MSSIPKEALDEYIGESREMCERISINIGLVEKKAHTDETLNSIYRDMHSIKGSSHLFGFNKIGNLAHAMETALEPVRDKVTQLTSEMIDILFAGLDVITRMLDCITTKGQEGSDIDSNLAKLIPRIADLTISAVGADHKILKSNTTSPESHLIVATPAPLPMPSPTQKKILTSIEPANKEDHSADTSTIRIPVGILDNLMNLVGELVLVRNQVLQFGDRNISSDFLKLSQRLNVVTAELQNDVMKTRMQPVGTILSKFHRVVRDMSRDLSKKIELKLEGTETELDKTLIEAVKDPLTHLIRNSVDHGLETPELRKKAGKHEIGTISIRSYHEGGQVIIEIKDDGRGLDPALIGRKAVEKAIVSSEQLAKMSERDIQSLIFAPGFSTAEKISSISGRGVGMDVVKTNIEKIGGTIELQSKVGSGTSIRLKIPLTLAIIPALIVKSHHERFAIPQVKVVELVRLERDNQNCGKIELLQGKPVYRLRGALLPLVDLAASLKLRPDQPNDIELSPVSNIVVLHSNMSSNMSSNKGSDMGTFGLIVDEIVDSADIVVKPLSQMLKSMSAYSGATIMGDGAVVLILDVAGLSAKTEINNRTDELGTDQKSQVHLIPGTDSTEYLIVDLGVPGKYAIPLCLVNRLEEIDSKLLDLAGEQRVVRYRNTLLPIISVAKQLNLPGHELLARPSDKNISMVVMSKMNRLFGLEVNNIVDVVSIDSEIDLDLSDRSGILGSLIAGKDVITILDTHKIIDDSIHKIDYHEKVTASSNTRIAKFQKSTPSTHVLLVEDTSFFRRHVKRILEDAGYRVTAVTNGEEAVKMLEINKNDMFSLVVSDIEMPIMGGFELATKIRSQKKWSTIPIIALTTKFKAADIDRGKEVGFNAYLEKLNPELLIDEMSKLTLDLKTA